uniref:Protein-L-isoaspartate O-methyltransferase domain-containing protein 1 n=1 Tax=Plectus sambesii TaxID=2011161 RepID=A0A914WY39_9BILA
MGGMVSAGEDNDELVDNLVDAGAVRSVRVETALRLIDRGRYYLPDERSAAYKDTAWRSNEGQGLLHISAPCIYANVLEELQLSPGHSFLNIGSGTGYLSTVAGVLIGSTGVNHGIELHKEIVDYAEKCLSETLASSEAIDFSDFAIPQFVTGNALLLDPSLMGGYDRVYCGAGVSERYHRFICSFVRVGGICVLPFGDELQKVTRTAMDSFDVEVVTSVTFASMIEPTAAAIGSGATVVLPERRPHRLLSSCRWAVRAAVRAQLQSKLHVEIRCRSKDCPPPKSDDDHGREVTRRRPRRRPLLMLAPDLSDDDADDVISQRRRVLRQRFFAAIADPGRVSPPAQAPLADEAGDAADEGTMFAVRVSTSESEGQVVIESDDDDGTSGEESTDDLESIQAMINIGALLEEAAEISQLAATTSEEADPSPRTSSKRSLSESSTLSHNSGAPSACKRRMPSERRKEVMEREAEKSKKQELRRKERLQQTEQLRNFSTQMVAELHQLPVTDKLRDYLSFGRLCRGDEIPN